LHSKRVKMVFSRGDSGSQGWSGGSAAELAVVTQPGSCKPKEKDGKPQTLESIEKGQQIRVKESPGFLYELQLNAKVEHSPQDVYDLLIDANAKCFRSIKSCTFRRTISDDGCGKRKLEVGHKAVARFLFIAVTFETRLLVDEDDNERTIRFANAKQGFMKAFDGTWHVQPFTQRSLDDVASGQHLSGQQQRHKLPPWMNPAAGIMGALHKLNPGQHATSLVTLEQRVLPSMPAPGPIKHLIRGLCAAQVKNMMEDLRKELDRREAARAKALKQGSSSSKHDNSKGASSSGKQSIGAAAAAACMSLGQPQDIWQHISPLIYITIQL